jgi:hypothetical protein
MYEKRTPAHRDFYARFASFDESKVPEGWQLDARLSDADRRVYLNVETRDVVVTHRATDPRKPRDIGNDAVLAYGIPYVARLSAAEVHAKAVRTLHPQSRITHTGFSLGGTVAMHLSRKMGESAVTYGAFTPPRWYTTDLMYGLLAGRKPQVDAVNYTVGSDPVSVTTNMAGYGTLVPSSGGNPHSIERYYDRGGM